MSLEHGISVQESEAFNGIILAPMQVIPTVSPQVPACEPSHPLPSSHATSSPPPHTNYPACSNTRKYKTFFGTKMAGKSVEHVPGIGQVTAWRLVDHGYTKATQLFGLFLKDRREFAQLLTQCGVNQRHQTDVFNAFQEWYDQNM